MPTSELCSACFVNRLKMMQASQFSIYNTFTWYQLALEAADVRCSLGSILTAPQPPLIPAISAPPLCVSGKTYTTRSGDTCDTIALAQNVSSAALFSGNPVLTNCTTLNPGVSLCLPLTCQTYQLAPTDDCISASISAGVGDITLYN